MASETTACVSSSLSDGSQKCGKHARRNLLRIVKHAANETICSTSSIDRIGNCILCLWRRCFVELDRILRMKMMLVMTSLVASAVHVRWSASLPSDRLVASLQSLRRFLSTCFLMFVTLFEASADRVLPSLFLVFLCARSFHVFVSCLYRLFWLINREPTVSFGSCLRDSQ